MRLHLWLVAGAGTLSIGVEAAIHDWTATRIGSFNAESLSVADFNNAGQLVATWDQGATVRGLLYTPGSAGGPVDLGSFGGTTTTPTALNMLGEVAGYATTASGASQAFVYRNGAMQRLALQGETSATAVGLNDRGQVLTAHAMGTERVGAIFGATGGPTLVSIPGSIDVNPYGINNRGQVFGRWSLPDDAPPSRTFFYDNGQAIDLGVGSFSFPRDMNESGQIIGNWRWSPFLYSGGEVTRIVVGAGDQYSTSAQDLNNRGQVLGDTFDRRDSGVEPFLYSDGVAHELTALVGHMPVHLNDLTQVTALSGGEEAHLVFYSDDDGRVTDLTRWLMNSFDDIASVDVTHTNFALNDLGQLAIPATLTNGERTIFVLTPVPEPSTFALMLVGAGLLAGAARRRNAQAGRPAAAMP